MILNYQITTHDDSTLVPMVFIHGLFGSLSNLGMLARHFASQRTVIQLDLRNHGLSGHTDQHDYHLMSEDVLETLDSLNITKFVVVGHSMGGKVAMKLADIARDRVEQLVVLDIASIQYHENHHAKIFEALLAVERANVNSRSDATKIMLEYLQEEMVIQFLLKSFNKGKWLFNVQALYKYYQDILYWEDLTPVDIPALFLRGGNSFYISKPEQFAAIERQFTHANVELIEGAGHWLHGEKPAQVLEHIQAFLDENQ